MSPSAAPTRRQYSSCDACRRSKRRCCLPPDQDGELHPVCTNCKRIGSPCTFDFAKSHSRAITRRNRRRHVPMTNLSGECDGPTSTAENAVDVVHDSQPVADQDILTSWLNIDLDHCLGDNSTPLLHSTEFPDILADNARPALHHDGIASSFLTHHSDTVQRPVLYNTRLKVGSSPCSPLYLLNSKLNATILDECLVRIHDTIVTGCASRFIDYECNLYKPRHCYQLDDGDCGRPQDQKPVQLDSISKGNVSITQDASFRMTILGAIRFLDHFSDLYGNRLTISARRKSDAVLKAVLRAFSLQWLSPINSTLGVQSTTNYNGTVGRDTPRDSSMDAFYDSWFQARSLINSARSVQSFRFIYAILMFDGISIPAKRSGETIVAHEYLDMGLQKLNCLTGLVEQYCMNLGPHSTYGTIIEASLSIVRWCSHVRDIGAALTADHVCKLSDGSGNDKGS